MSLESIIIGSGPGGLFCGALLARNGFKVTVLEKNSLPGGGLQDFVRNGQVFETGMHYVAGFQSGGIMDSLCHYLGIKDDLKLEAFPRDGFESVYIGGDHYLLPSGLDRTVEYLSRIFPQETDGLKDWASELYSLYPINGLGQVLKEGVMSPSPDLSIKDFLERHISDPRLRSLLLWNYPLFYGNADTCPAFVYAMITRSFLEGAFRLAGGSGLLSGALIKIIQNAGGKVLCRKEVVSMEMDQGSISRVICGDGSVFTAPCVISSIPLKILSSIVPQSGFKKAFRERIDNAKPTASAFTMFVTFKKEVFPYIPQNCFYYKKYGYPSVPSSSPGEPGWPESALWMTPAAGRQGKWAGNMIVMVPMDIGMLEPWARTKTKKRGEDYEAFKASAAEGIHSLMRKFYPLWDSAVESVFCATPLTIRDYAGSTAGECFGMCRTISNTATEFFLPRTKIPNLFLCGQDLQLHGLLGVSLTSWMTAAAVLKSFGRNIDFLTEI